METPTIANDTQPDKFVELSKIMESPIISQDLKSDKYIKWMEQYERYFDKNYAKNEEHWEDLDEEGLCINLVDPTDCRSYSNYRKLRWGYFYRPVHKFVVFKEMECVGHGGDEKFIRDLNFVLKEKLRDITNYWPKWHYKAEFTTFQPTKKTIEFKYDQVNGYDSDLVHRLLLEKDMLFDILVNDTIRLTVDVDIDHSSSNCSCYRKLM